MKNKIDRKYLSPDSHFSEIICMCEQGWDIFFINIYFGKILPSVLTHNLQLLEKAKLSTLIKSRILAVFKTHKQGVIYNQTQLLEEANGAVLWKNLFLKISQILLKTPVLESLFNKNAVLRLQHKCFPVKFLRAPTMTNICERQLPNYSNYHYSDFFQ